MTESGFPTFLQDFGDRRGQREASVSPCSPRLLIFVRDLQGFELSSEDPKTKAGKLRVGHSI